jgi:hypothetical protein
MVEYKGTQERLNSSFSSINYGSTDGNSIGHYGSLSAIHPMSKSFLLQGTYTWGKALDVYSNSSSLTSGSATSSTSII